MNIGATPASVRPDWSGRPERLVPELIVRGHLAGAGVLADVVRHGERLVLTGSGLPGGQLECLLDRRGPGGRAFELETLDAEPWRRRWIGLGISDLVAGQAWRPFMLRYATAVAPLPAELHAATTGCSFAELSRAAAAAGVAVQPLRTHSQRCQELNGHDLFTAPWTVEPTGPANAGPGAELAPGFDDGPLTGMVVVEAGRRVQGPLAGHLLGLLGAGVEARIVEGDALEFVEPHSYDVVLNMFTSFGYCEDPADNARILRNMNANLASGGLLLLDLAGKEILARRVLLPKVVRRGDDLLVQTDTVLDDWARMRSDWVLVRDDRICRASLVWFIYSAVELRAMVAEAGFTDVECFGDFDAQPYNENAERLIIRATKA